MARTGLVAGNAGQLVPQLIGMLTVIAWAFGTGFILFRLLKTSMGLRVSDHEETVGLDITEHGLEAYAVDSATA